MNAALAPDVKVAQRFLALIDEDANGFMFQTATDSEPKPKPDPLARSINLPPDNLKALVTSNGNGAAIWVMINEGDGKGRTAANVTRVRAVFADLDGSPLALIVGGELEPHCVVETSPGKYHAYWLVDGLPLDLFEGVQRRIATMFNGDHVIDLCRVMRLPGFVHQKDPAKPFMVRIVRQAERLPYSAADILRVFPPLADGGPKVTGNGRADLLDPLDPVRLAELKAAHPQVFDHHYKSPSERDFALACLACRLGWPQDDAVALVRAAQHRAKADRPDYLWRTVTNAYQRAAPEAPLDAAPEQLAVEAEEDKKTRRSIATELVRIALAGTELFTTPGDQIAYAAFEVDDHREVWPLRSRGFKMWLGRQLYEASNGKKTASAQAITDALVTIEGAAMFDGAVREVHLRVAHHDGRYYLDLADDRWRAVEIAASGWRVVTRPPVYFRRTRGTLPLPEPVPGGSLDPLRALLNVGTEDDGKMMIAWMLAALRPAGPYPVLDLAGEQGSAKSTTARALRALIDPGEPMIRAAPKQERDLAIAVTNGHALVLDNLSDVQPWLSDALCRFATGGGWACRQLYTDDDQILIDAMKPIMINGIEELALRPDLKDRTIAVVLPTIEEERRIEESEFWARFEAARPAILGALLDVMAAGLANLPNVKLRRMPRMADFARWIASCEPALGWEPGSFAEIYNANRTALGELAIEANETIRMVRDNAICHDEHETVGSLLDKLRALCGDDRAQLKELPKTPRALGGLLRRYAPELRTAGLDVVFGKRTMTGWPVTIREKVRAQPSQPSYRHNSAENPQKASGSAYGGSHDGSDSPAEPSWQPSCSKANESATRDGHDGHDGSAGTRAREESPELTLGDLDRMAGEGVADDWGEFDDWISG